MGMRKGVESLLFGASLLPCTSWGTARLSVSSPPSSDFSSFEGGTDDSPLSELDDTLSVSSEAAQDDRPSLMASAVLII